MNGYIKNYDGISRMCIVAKDDAALTKLQSQNVPVFYVGQNALCFYPDVVTMPIENISQEKAVLLRDYDIVEFHPNGTFYRMFGNEEPDTTLFMGGGCNSNCIMCPAGDAERRHAYCYAHDQLMQYIRFLPDDLEFLVITGGEPTLNPSLFIEALEAVRDKFCDTNVLLLTNGRSFSNKAFFDETINCLPHHFRVAIPIHGANPALHDSITQAPGSFEQTRKAVHRFLQAKVSVEIRIVVTQVNSDELLPIAKLINKEFTGITCVNFIGLEPRGNCAKNFSSVFIDYGDSFAKSKDAIDYLIRNGFDVGLYNYPLCSIDRQYWNLAVKSISQYKNEFLPQCDECDVKEICAGFFTAAKRIAHPQAFPIKKAGEEHV